MTKHNNYESTAEITLVKVGDNLFRLSYQEEDWELLGSKDEILEELGEHMELMKGEK